MATTKDLIVLAEQIAARLKGVSRNDWMRWMQLARRYGTEKAIHYARQLANDPTLRPAQQRANRLIAETLPQFRSQINSLHENEAHKLYGWIAWSLVIQKRGL
jgi:hypothetical protein